MSVRRDEKGADLLPKSNGDRAPDHGASGRLKGAAGALRRRIFLFNLVALNALALGGLYLGGSHDALMRHRAETVLQSVTHMAQGVAARLPADAPDGVSQGGAAAALNHVQLAAGSELWLLDPTERLLAHRTGDADPQRPHASHATPMIDALSRVTGWITAPAGPEAAPQPPRDRDAMARALVVDALGRGAHLHAGDPATGTGIRAAAPVGPAASPTAVLVLSDAAGGLDALIRAEQERVLRISLIAALISVGLSLVLARAVSAPLADLAQTAEIGKERTPDARGTDAGRLPELTGPPDEVDRLSDSLRGMVAALYQRIESNEQFAADVAHEIKNPLTSLRCAVDTMRTTTREDQRARLLEVIEHDVRRLDRLVSDISRASRLDSDLVREDQARFDLLETLRNLGQSLEAQAVKKEVAFITDFPDQPIVITGLEARLAQVFVNLITNAISFCGPGDAIRVWARRRGDRVLVVVEDTGPGLPEGTTEKVFERFYSNRPSDEFGNHSGLGLAISKQIVEAHDGVIWAENIPATGSGAIQGATGARFVVGLSV
jgi:two-component system sensor histidine kinase ChvG